MTRMPGELVTDCALCGMKRICIQLLPEHSDIYRYVCQPCGKLVVEKYIIFLEERCQAK